MEYAFTIRGRYSGNYCFPSLNQYIAEVGRNPKAGNQFKQKYEFIVVRSIRASLKNLKLDKPVYIHYIFGEPDKGRDVSNIVSGAVKIIEDGMQKAFLIKNDNPTCLKDYSHEIRYIGGKELPYIKIIISEV